MYRVTIGVSAGMALAALLPTFLFGQVQTDRPGAFRRGARGAPGLRMGGLYRDVRTDPSHVRRLPELVPGGQIWVFFLFGTGSGWLAGWRPFVRFDDPYLQ